MHLVLCPDDAYAEHAAVALASVLANVAQPRRVKAWIVANDLSARSRAVLERVAARFGGRIAFPAIDAARLRGVPLGAHITLASYYRLLAPAHLPPEVERFLYLDSDLVAEADISPLFDVDLAGGVLAAVANSCTWHGQIGLPAGAPYFNAGVLMVDRRRWEAERVSERVLAVIAEKRESLRYWDQDAINLVFAGRWTRLDPRWNQQHYFPFIQPAALGFEPAAMKRALDDPFIVHFTGGSKPWHAKDRHPFRARYRHYRRRAGLPPLWLRPSHFKEAFRTLLRGGAAD